MSSILRDPVPYQGALAALTIERLNGFVGLLVGVATLVYLCLQIRKEVARQRESSRTRDRSSTP